MSTSQSDLDYEAKFKKLLKIFAMCCVLVLIGNEIVLRPLPKAMKDVAQTFGLLAGMLATILYNYVLLFLAIRMPWPEAAWEKQRYVVKLVLVGNLVLTLLMGGLYFTGYLSAADDTILWAELGAVMRNPLELLLLQALGMIMIGLAMYLIFSKAVHVKNLIEWAYIVEPSKPATMTSSPEQSNVDSDSDDAGDDETEN